MANSRNGREANAKHPCPCCGKQKHCLIFQDGGANCYHTNDPAFPERQDRNGASYRLFPAGEGQRAPGPDPLPTLEHSRASVDKVNRVYRELQQQLTLNQAHHAQLLKRGLPDVAIREHGFKAMHSPAVRSAIAQSIADRFSDWQGVPGFYRDAKTAKARLAGSEGLVIFGKDLAGNVVSVQIRRDTVKTDQARYYWLSSAKHGGPSSGSFPAWWPPVSRARAEGLVRVTEGALKAAVAAELTGVPGIAAGAGVGSMASDAVLEMLRELGPRTVLFTPDADAFKNDRVAGHVRDALGKLRSSGFQLLVETWDGAAKGIDDALQAGLEIRTETPEAYLARLPGPDETDDGAEKVVLSGISGQKAEQILRAIRQANRPLKVFVWKPTGKLSDLRQSGDIIQCTTPEGLAHLCENRLGLRFYGKNKEGQEFPIDPPEKVLKRILGMPPVDTELPVISEFLSSPVLAEDGTLVVKSGLHPSGVFLRPGLNIARVPEKPSDSEVKQALQQLGKLIEDFPFEGAEDRQAWFSYLLTGFVAGRAPRPWPMWNFSAPLQGSGKGLLASLPAFIAQGEPPSVISVDTSEKDPEIRKKLTALLDSNPARWQILDNVRGHLASSALEAFLTSTTWTDRILGGSKMGSWPNKVALAITGNNLTLSPDLERRQILIRLLPDTDKPWLRKDFAIPDLSAYAREHRATLIRCVLVLISSWAAKGFPLSERRLGSFEGWSAAIGGLLESIGVGSEFLASTRVPVKDDPWAVFIQLWTESHLEGRQPASELVRFIDKAGVHLAEGSPAHSLGKRLARLVGRVFSVEAGPGKPKMVRLTTIPSGSSNFWFLEPVEPRRGSSTKTNPGNPANPGEPYEQRLCSVLEIPGKSRPPLLEIPPPTHPPLLGQSLLTEELF